MNPAPADAPAPSEVPPPTRSLLRRSLRVLGVVAALLPFVEEDAAVARLIAQRPAQ